MSWAEKSRGGQAGMGAGGVEEERDWRLLGQADKRLYWAHHGGFVGSDIPTQGYGYSGVWEEERVKSSRTDGKFRALAKSEDLRYYYLVLAATQVKLEKVLGSLAIR